MVEIGQLVDVAAPPGLRPEGAAAAHGGVHGAGDDILGHPARIRSRPRGVATHTGSPSAMPRAAASGVLIVDQRFRQLLGEPCTPWCWLRKSWGVREPELKTRGNSAASSGRASGPSCRFGVDRQRIVAVLGEDRGGDLEFAARGVEAGPAVGAQLPFLPFLVLRHHRRHLHAAAVAPAPLPG